MQAYVALEIDHFEEFERVLGAFPSLQEAQDYGDSNEVRLFSGGEVLGVWYFHNGWKEREKVA